MKCKSVLIVMLLFGSVTYSEAQWEGGYCGGPGPCGPIPIAVYDVKANPDHWVTQIVKTIAILTDMLTQAKRGAAGDSHAVAGLIDAIARTQIGGSMTYGNHASDQWAEVYPMAVSWEDGRWLDSAKDRDQRAYDTLRTLQRQLEMRQEAFPESLDSATELISAASHAVGRNQIMAAQAGIEGRQLKETLVLQQEMMKNTNVIAASEVQKLSERSLREEQERYFLTNGDKPVERVQWDNPGIY